MVQTSHQLIKQQSQFGIGRAPIPAVYAASGQRLYERVGLILQAHFFSSTSESGEFWFMVASFPKALPIIRRTAVRFRNGFN